MSQPQLNVEPPKETWQQSAWRNIKSLVPALLIVFAIRSSIAEPFKIPSGSMIPTLFIGDYVFVNKFAYGFKVPFTEWFTDPVYITKNAGPKRGDIIVFLYPRDESVNFIKRVVGTPGDKIEVREKVLYVNGKAFDQTPVDPLVVEKSFVDMQDPTYLPARFDVKTETIDQGDSQVKKHSIMMEKGAEATSYFGPVTVPADHFFCMGDNRDGSNDSRFWGFVPFKNIKGRAFVIWMSMWLDFGRSNFIFRPSRMGTLL